MEQMGKKIEHISQTVARIQTSVAATGQELIYEYMEFIFNAIEDSEQLKEQYARFNKAHPEEIYQFVLGVETENPVDKSIFEKRLYQEGVIFIGGDKIRDAIITGQDGSKDVQKGYIYFVHQEDVNKVREIRKELVLGNKENMMLKMERLGTAEAVLMQKHMKEQAAYCEIYENRNNEYNLLYSRENRKNVDYAKIITSIELSGEDGKKLCAQQEYKMEQAIQMEQHIFDRNESEPFFLANQDYTLKVEKSKVIFIDPEGKKLEIPKKEENRSAICGCFRRMDTFIVLKPKEFEKFQQMNEQQKIDKVKDNLIKDGMPVFTKEQLIIAQQKKQTLAQLIHKINPELILNEKTKLTALDEKYVLSEEKIPVSISNFTEKELEDVLRLAMEEYYHMEDQDKHMTVDSVVREKIENSLKGRTLEDIYHDVERKKELQEQEHANMTAEEKLEQAEDLRHMSEAADFDNLWKLVSPETER